MQQIVDLQNDPDFRSLNVEVLSIAFDSQSELAAGKLEYDITDVPLLTDTNGQVSADYDLLKWAVRSGEPSHTFVLVDGEGQVAWIRDYGSPTLPDPVMYVPVAELVEQIAASLSS